MSSASLRGRAGTKTQKRGRELAHQFLHHGWIALLVANHKIAKPLFILPDARGASRFVSARNLVAQVHRIAHSLSLSMVASERLRRHPRAHWRNLEVSSNEEVT